MLPATFPAFVVNHGEFEPGSLLVALDLAVVCHRTDDEEIITVIDHHNAAQYDVSVGKEWRGAPFPFSIHENVGEADPHGDLVLFCDYKDCLPDCG